jgi:SAM-dependent methyltransferase
MLHESVDGTLSNTHRSADWLDFHIPRGLRFAERSLQQLCNGHSFLPGCVPCIKHSLTGLGMIERQIYGSWFSYALNQLLLPLKLLVPQPVVKALPLLTTNETLRTAMVLGFTHGRLLDIGCGHNRLVREYRQNGGCGFGVDVHPWPNVNLVVADTASLPYPDSAFDTITFVACLNHIPNRFDVLCEARRLLRPGGHVILTNLSPRLSRLWHAWAFWDADQHERGMKEGEVYGFSRGELAALLSQAGFRLVQRTPFSWGLNAVYVFEPTYHARQGA